MKPSIVETTGAPYCPLEGVDQRRGYTKAENTNIARTLEEFRPPRVSGVQMLDDYDLTDALGHLETVGAFK